MLEKVIQQTWKNMKKEVKTGAKIHQKAMKKLGPKLMQKKTEIAGKSVDPGAP